MVGQLGRRVAGAVVGLSLAGALGAFMGMRDRPGDAIVAVHVTAQPLPLDTSDPARTRLGPLQYQGGLQLISKADGWGGLSGLRVLPDGRLLAISDRGSWLLLSAVEQAGRLVGAGNALMGPLRDEAGKPLGHPWYDAEGLELVPDGQGGSDALVSFERHHRVWRYGAAAPDMAAKLSSTPQPVDGWPMTWLATLPENGGLEALAVTGGASLGISEDTSVGRFRADASSPWLAFNYKGQEGFKPTDAAFLPVPGRRLALVLSRHFSLMHGVAATLEVADLDQASSGTVTGRLLARLAPPVSVDNMEGLAVAPLPGGDFAVYLISDDNQNALQRTILLKFTLPASALER